MSYFNVWFVFLFVHCKVFIFYFTFTSFKKRTPNELLLLVLFHLMFLITFRSHGKKNEMYCKTITVRIQITNDDRHTEIEYKRKTKCIYTNKREYADTLLPEQKGQWKSNNKMQQQHISRYTDKSNQISFDKKTNKRNIRYEIEQQNKTEFDDEEGKKANNRLKRSEKSPHMHKL